MSNEALMAEVRQREANRKAGRPLDAPPVDVSTPADREADDARLEKTIVAEADRQMRALGFVMVNLSQPRATKQTPGIPDRQYFHPGRGVFLVWEAKTPTGRQSPAQRQYQEWCDCCGIPYVLGTDEVLYAWLVARGIACDEGGLLVALPYVPQQRTA